MNTFNLLPRIAIAAIWLYQGGWCKLLGRMPHHEEIVAMVPFLNSTQAHDALLVLGLLECALGVWVMSGFAARRAALLQTLLLASMNTAGLIWARHAIPDPAGMVLQNFTLVVLAWMTAGKQGVNGAGA